jgi:hypothetical protein
MDLVEKHLKCLQSCIDTFYFAKVIINNVKLYLSGKTRHLENEVSASTWYWARVWRSNNNNNNNTVVDSEPSSTNNNNSLSQERPASQTNVSVPNFLGPIPTPPPMSPLSFPGGSLYGGWISSSGLDYCFLEDLERFLQA